MSGVKGMHTDAILCQPSGQVLDTIKNKCNELDSTITNDIITKYRDKKDISIIDLIDVARDTIKKISETDYSVIFDSVYEAEEFLNCGHGNLWSKIKHSSNYMGFYMDYVERRK